MQPGARLRAAGTRDVFGSAPSCSLLSKAWRDIPCTGVGGCTYLLADLWARSPSLWDLAAAHKSVFCRVAIARNEPLRRWCCNSPLWGSARPSGQSLRPRRAARRPPATRRRSAAPSGICCRPSLLRPGLLGPPLPGRVAGAGAALLARSSPARAPEVLARLSLRKCQPQLLGCVSRSSQEAINARNEESSAFRPVPRLFWIPTTRRVLLQSRYHCR